MEAHSLPKDIQLAADVECADGVCGVCIAVVLDPQSDTVTHLVIREREFPHTERLVPLSRAVRAHATRIWLDCRLTELQEMPQFVETEYVTGPAPYDVGPMGMPQFAPLILEHERVPEGEVAMHPGGRVQAADGPAGHIEGFLIDPSSGHITHLVLREGPLWGQKNITVPVSAIHRMDEDTVYLNLTRAAIGALPAVPAHRRAAGH